MAINNYKQLRLNAKISSMKNYAVKSLMNKDPNLVQEMKNLCFDINGCCMTVHREMGPHLNEYMYQDALEILFEERGLKFLREFYFSVEFHGKRIHHKHYVDFLCKDQVFIECKAVETLGPEQRQQLWNYMRLTKTHVGILWNFAPNRDQSEHYYLDTDTDEMYLF